MKSSFLQLNKFKLYNIAFLKTSTTNIFFIIQGVGIMQWAIDDFYVGGMIVKPNVLYDPLDLIPQPDAWLFWPGGTMGDFCSK